MIKKYFKKIKENKKLRSLKKLINFRNFCILIVTGVLLVIMVLIYFSINLPNINNLGTKMTKESLKIYDRTGKVLLYDQIQAENRQYLSFDKIPNDIKQAVMSAEDDNFYAHGALDYPSFFKAIVSNLLRISRQGGSTITQQLARNAFLTQDRKISRKIREIILSFYLEKQYSKDKIFEMYLNQVPFGLNAYGIESASQLYFSKSAKDLNLTESAYLASLLQSPSYLSPFGNHRDKLDSRKNWVLDRLVKLGWKDQKTVSEAKKLVVEFKSKRQSILAPHFVAYLQSELANKYGEDFIQRTGVSIITTIDYNLQKKAEEVVKQYGDQNESKYNIKNMALLSQDSSTGQILAMVGSRDFWNYDIDGNFNAVFGLRQPGSSFKPFAYLKLFENGFQPETVLFDVKTNFSTDINNPYTPHNYDKIFRGPINLRNALAQSLNIPAVKVLYLAGIDSVIKLAENFGITTLGAGKNHYGLSLVLGGGAVNLYDMVGAYSVLSDEGVRHTQSVILKIIDKEGNIIEEYKDDSKVVFDNPNYINMVSDVLSDNIARTPLFNTFNNSLYFGENIDVAAKTGTSSDSRDAWVLGYTPNIVTGVWVGNNDYSPMFKGPTGGVVAAPAWHAFMDYAISLKPIERFTKPNYAIVSKPMLNGQYINQVGGTIQAHDILFYVDKSDPLGSIPRNPQNDPQYYNWETPAIEWLKQYIVDFDLNYNKPLNDYDYNPSYKPEPVSTTGPVSTTIPIVNNLSIDFVNISNNQNVTSDFEARIQIASQIELEVKALYLNGAYLGDLTSISNGMYNSQIKYADLLPGENNLKVYVRDGQGNIMEKEVKIIK